MVQFCQYVDQVCDMVVYFLQVIDETRIEVVSRVLDMVKELSESKHVKRLSSTGTNVNFVQMILGLVKCLENELIRFSILQVLHKCVQLDKSGESKAELISGIKLIITQESTSMSDFVACGLILEKCIGNKEDFLLVVALFGEATVF